MTAEPVQGIERAVFGAVTADDVTAWLDRHVARRLSARVSQVLFRTGRVSAVYGCTCLMAAASWPRSMAGP